MEAEKRQDQELPISPREKANFLSYVFFIWIVPIFLKGRKKELSTDDLYRPLKVHKSETLGAKLSQSWDDEVQKKQKLKKEPSLFKAMWAVFKWDIAFGALVTFILEFVIRMTQPIFIFMLVKYYQSKNGNINEAYLWAGGILLCSLLNLLIIHPFMLGQSHLGMRMRIAAISMIYRKSLRLTRNALGNTTAGQVVNLLSNDVGRFDTSILFVHYIWAAPLEVVAVSVILYYTIGVSTFAGVLFLLLFLPVQMYIGKLAATLRLKTALRTDIRIRFMQEIVNGIMVIKMYAWEKPFAKVVASSRAKEIAAIRTLSYIRGIMLSFMMFTSRSAIFLSLMTYVLLGKFLEADKAFTVTAYFNLLRTSMTMLLPQGIVQMTETFVSIRRIQKFLCHPELPRSAEELKRVKERKNVEDLELQKSNLNGINEPSTPKDIPYRIKLTDAYAKWEPENSEYTLNKVNAVLDKEKLIAVIGPVGSGKSSLLQAMLEELPLQTGSIEINGDIAYASQEPWLFSATVRQNILFGMPYEKKRYQEVVKVCALETDFTLFPHGDKTLVGDRGASLSGGQKARINLARAVYRKASIYLLDDPLSAVDSHVGRHLFDECIRRYLRGSTVVLITHQLQYLRNADHIIMMDHGCITSSGTYDHLVNSGLDFAKLLNNADDKDEKLKRQFSRQESTMSSISDASQRKLSVLSVTSNDVDMIDSNAMEEKRDSGIINREIYFKYFRACGGWGTFTLTLILFILSQVLASGGDFYLTYWTNKNQRIAPEVEADGIKHRFVRDTSGWDEFWSNFGQFFNDLYADPNFDIYVFAIITILTIVISLARSFIFFNAAMRASINLHNVMFSGISRASMYFFNTNPSGRILNRFSKDIGQIDELLPAIMIDMVQIFLTLIGIIVVVSIVNPIFIAPTFVLIVLFWFLRVFYLTTSTSIKRVEATTRSPIYSHLSASLNGLATIRAFKAEPMLIEEFDNHQDLHSSAYYLFIAAARAFGFSLDGSCLIYVTIIILSFFLFDESGGNVGLVITQILGMTGMVQWGMRQSAELENTFTAVERVVEYETIDPEAALESEPDKKPPETWPEKGDVVFDKLSMRYAPEPNSDRVLKDLDLQIHPNEKIGIVGRTGAGKTSLINALFRLSYNDGKILIDTRDTNELGLHDLRAKISIIPQEPVLFSGTLRYNLDPFDEFSDDKLWMALDEVKLKSAITELPSGLLSKISEGGTNFSVGQRQLVCLARAVLRDNKILVMDEATANVDPQTDGLIQETIRSKFANCTVLTIAHRLNTIMDSDRVLVMDAGKCVEFAPPYELLTTKEGPRIFYGMVMQTGKGSFDYLFSVAKQSYKPLNQKKDN